MNKQMVKRFSPKNLNQIELGIWFWEIDTHLVGKFEIDSKTVARRRTTKYTPIWTTQLNFLMTKQLHLRFT